MHPDGPVRLCCGQRHWTTQCPDGLVMCCLCFERVPPEELARNDNGDLEDVCIPCQDHELARMEIDATTFEN